MPTLDLTTAKQIFSGGAEVMSLWIAGVKRWQKPATSILRLDAQLALLDNFTITSSSADAIGLSSSNTQRRVASWAVSLKAGDVVNFAYTCAAPLHCRTSATSDVFRSTDAVVAGVAASTPASVSFTLTKDAPYFGFVFGSGAVTSSLSVTGFTITRP